jgi:hypothetical protein
MPAQLKQVFSSIFLPQTWDLGQPNEIIKDPNAPSPWLIHHAASRRPGALTGSGDGLTQDHLLTEMFDEQGSPGMYANILLSTDGSDVARKGLEHGIALAKALDAKVTVITVTEPLPIDFGGGHAGGWIPSPEEVDRYDAACKERAGCAQWSPSYGGAYRNIHRALAYSERAPSQRDRRNSKVQRLRSYRHGLARASRPEEAFLR